MEDAIYKANSREKIVKDWTKMTWEEQARYLQETVEELEQDPITIESYNVIRRLLDMKYRIMIINNINK